jgi:uncharacterized protein Yka (UPF0111/DUF47 family)
VGALQQFIKMLVPREEVFFDFLDAAAVAADDAAAHFVDLCRAQGRDAQTVQIERIRDAEHAGDLAKKSMTAALDRTFVTPKATAELRAAVPLLRTASRFEELRAACQRVAMLENESDVIFRLRLGDLFAQEKDAIRLIKHKEFLEGLERSVDECAHVASYLEAILIKNA